MSCPSKVNRMCHLVRDEGGHISVLVKAVTHPPEDFKGQGFEGSSERRKKYKEKESRTLEPFES